MNIRTTWGTGFFLFACTFLFVNTTSAQLYTKLQWMPQDTVWGVFVKTDTSIQPSQNILLGSGQITIVAPTGFQLSSMDSYMGTWDQNARANGPIENREMDYISFGIKLSEPITELGRYEEVLVLTFSSASNDCPNSLYLIENDDPFVAQIPNSLNTNPGNDMQMVDLGNNRSIYSYSGNYDLESWDCNSTDNITTSIEDLQRKRMVKVFPNPFREELVFEVIEKGLSPNFEVKLSDNLGRTIVKERMNQNRLNVTVKADAALYFYEIIDLETNELVESGKLFKW